MTTIFKTQNTGDIATNSYKELDWTPDRRIKVTHVILTEKNDYSLSPVRAYIKIADVPYTKDYVPASVIGQDREYCWKPDLVVEKGAKIYMKLENTGVPTVNIDITYEYEEL